MAPINPLRAAPRPFIKKEVKREGTRPIPFVKTEEVDNPEDFNEYPLKACTQKDIDNVRTHILKFQAKNKVDPLSQFTKPIRLHRKETKNLQYQLTRAEIEQRQKEYAEVKRLEEERLQKEAEEREANGLADPNSKPVFDISLDPNVAPEPEVKTEEQKLQEKKEKQLAHIAPDGGARKNKQQIRKTRRIHQYDEKKKKLRYEEYYPWVMEDYDGKNTWVGSYEAGSSDTYALLVFDQSGFKMIPADKVYKFTPRNRYSTLTLAEAEARMQKHGQVPRWLMKHLEPEEKKLTRFERTKKKLKTVEGTSENDKGGRDSDNDDLDFEEDFADDEEAPIIDGNEEENKESEEKIKREMRGANALGLRDEGEEADDNDDLFEDRKFDKDGQRVRKALRKTDLGGIYESDDEDSNPYLSDSDLENLDKSDDEELINADLSKQGSPAPGENGRKDSSSPHVRTIKVKLANRPIGIVVLQALPSVLIKFPKGDWNPNAKKRLVENTSDEGRPIKRVKLENSDIASIPQEESSESVIKVEEGGATEQAAKFANENLLTEQDIIDIVTVENVTAKELIHKLKQKLSKHADNKNRIKVLVKKLLKNQNGYLVLKTK